MWPMGLGQLWPQGQTFSNFGSGSQDDAPCKISKPYPLFPDKKIFKMYPYINLYKTCDPRGWTNYDPKDKLLATLVEGY